MRIGMMADIYKPHISGITNYIELNKKYLEMRGHEVFIFTFGNLDYPDTETNVIRSPGMPLIDTGYYLNFRYSAKARRLLQTMDVVHVHHPFLSGRLALRYCRPIDIPIVFTNHTRYDIYAQTYMPMLPDEVSEILLQTYMPNFCEAVDLVVAPSPGIASVLRRLGVEGHIEVVPNGVEISRFQRAKPASRRQYGFRTGDLLYVYTGRLAPEKNLPLLLEAFRGAAQALPNLHLVLVGSGPEEEKLKKMAAKWPVRNRIHFMGRVPYEEIPGFLAMCDAFVTASISEVHPLSVIEAMGAGLAVLGAYSVGVGDTVRDGETGLLTEATAPAFAAQMTRLALQPESRRQFGANARQNSSQYDINRTVSVMLQHYDRLVYRTRPLRQGLRARWRRFWNRRVQ
jgi:glycosyltransferase involved in cell wall biosynthesis